MLKELGFAKVGPIGIYALCRGNEVLYVGQSRNLASRLSDHKKGRIKYDEIWVLCCEEEDLLRLEEELIHCFRPRFNQRIRNGYAPSIPTTLNIFEILGHERPFVRRV